MRRERYRFESRRATHTNKEYAVFNTLLLEPSHTPLEKRPGFTRASSKGVDANAHSRNETRRVGV